MGLELTSDFYSFSKNVAEENTRVLYSLYGVVEHSGTMRSGHYTAYAKTRTANSHLFNLVLHGDIPQGRMSWKVLVFRLWQNQKIMTLNLHLYLILHGLLTDFEMQSTKGQWFHISDSHVQAVPTTQVLNSQAYLLFYERIL